MAQGLADPHDRQLFQVPARLAQFDTAQDDVANLEIAADQMVERHTARERAAPRAGGIEDHVVFLTKGRQLLRFR